MENQSKITLDSICADGCLSVLTQTFNTATFNVENHREALAPGNFERAKEILPENLYQQICALWTDDIVTAYQTLMKENEKEISAQVEAETEI